MEQMQCYIDTAHKVRPEASNSLMFYNYPVLNTGFRKIRCVNYDIGQSHLERG